MENKIIILTTILILFIPSILVMYTKYKDEEEINEDVFEIGVVCFVCTFITIFLVSITCQNLFFFINWFLGVK